MTNETPVTIDGVWTKEDQERIERHKRTISDLVQQLIRGTGYIAAAREVLRLRPFYYDNHGLWWMYDHTRHIWEQCDETTLLINIGDALDAFGDTTILRKQQLIEALRQESRRVAPERLGTEWIQFGTSLYNITTGQHHIASSCDFSTNAISWTPSKSTETPTMDRLFREWVGPDRVATLYEILAYACYRDYPIHTIIVLNGNGSNGKSSFLRIFTRFLGTANVVNTDLSRLTKNLRFETFNLWRKLAATMPETDIGTIEGTSLLKQLTGQDLTTYEPKGKNAFSERNYCKLLIATNSLPFNDDGSDGFYRRWLIIDFPHQFSEGKDIVETIPEAEYCNLASKVLTILPDLLARGSFTGQGSIEERRQRYLQAANPFSVFIEEACVRDDAGAVRSETLYTQYARWLQVERRRVPSQTAFAKILLNAGFEKRRTWHENENGVWVFGLRLKATPADYVKGVKGVNTFSTQFPIWENSMKTPTHPSQPFTETRFIPVSDESIEALRRIKQPMTRNDIAQVFPGTDIDTVISNLLSNGDIFEQSPGLLRVLE